MTDPPQVTTKYKGLGPREWTITGISLAVVCLFLLAPTSFRLGKLDAVAYAVCHRIPERSFFLGGQQLPLCARCSGTFLGVLLTFVTLTVAGRSRSSRLPPRRVLVILVCFVLVWAVDGINSYLTLYPGAPHLYEPQNWLRLTTGMLNGLALGTLVFSIFQFSLWYAPKPQPTLRGVDELAGVLVLAALLIGLVLSGNSYLLYPLAVASTLGVLIMLTSVNTVIVLVAARRENTVLYWREAAWPVLIALAMSLVIVIGIGGGRAALSAALGMPF